MRLKFWKRNETPEIAPKSKPGFAIRWFRRVKLATSLFLLALMVSGAFILFGASHYTLWYVVCPGEIVSVEKVMSDNTSTGWFGRSLKDDPRIIVKKTNGQLRNFIAPSYCQNLQPGDLLVMTLSGRYACMTKPIVSGQTASASPSYLKGVPDDREPTSAEPALRQLVASGPIKVKAGKYSDKEISR